MVFFPVLCCEKPTGGNGATRAPIRIDLNKDGSLSSQSIVLLIDNKSQDVSPSKNFFFSIYKYDIAMKLYCSILVA